MTDSWDDMSDDLCEPSKEKKQKVMSRYEAITRAS